MPEAFCDGPEPVSAPIFGGGKLLLYVQKYNLLFQKLKGKKENESSRSSRQIYKKTRASAMILERIAILNPQKYSKI